MTESARATKPVTDALAGGRRSTAGARGHVAPAGLVGLQRAAGNAAVSALIAGRLKLPSVEAAKNIDAGLRKSGHDETMIDTVEKAIKPAKAAGASVEIEARRPPSTTLPLSRTGFGPASAAPKNPVLPTTSVPTVSRRDDPAAKGGKAAGGGAPVDRLGDWVGAGETGKIFRNDAFETYVDKGSNETVEVRTDWTLAEFKSYELKTDAVLEVKRTIKIRLATGTSVLIRSRARTWFFAERLPNDVRAALQAPAKSIVHDGTILVTEADAVKGLSTVDHKLEHSDSVAAMLGREPMLGFETDPKQRLEEARYFTTATLPGYERNLVLLAAIFDSAPRITMALKDYIKKKLEYFSPDKQPLTNARFLIEQIRELMTYSWTGYEGSDLYLNLGLLKEKVEQLVGRAETVKPAEKSGWAHALDAVEAVGKAIKGLGVAVLELGAMARDLGMKGLDLAANVFGYEIEWKAWSTIGKAYESGKSTKEIFFAVVNGFIDQWSQAFERAGNGDYSGVMDLGVELALDIGIEIASMGTATPAVAAKRVGTAARILTFTTEAAEAIVKRTKGILAKSKQLIKNAPAAAKKALLDTIDAIEGLVEGMKAAFPMRELAGTGRRMLGLEPGAIPQAMQRVRGARALNAAKTAVGGMPAAAKKAGNSILRKLEAWKKSSPDTVYALAARMAKGDSKFVRALDDALDAVRRLDDDVAMAALRRATEAVDPVDFLKNIEWAMSHRGIRLDARRQLVRQAVMRDNPLDLAWLRSTELTNPQLQFLALDPATNWATFMKVSKKPSDYFPSALKKTLTKRDYAQAGAKLRGVAGEMMFVVDKVPLPGDLRIVARQVDALGRKIDFGLETAAGHPALLEVKAFNARRWENELRNFRTRKKLGRGASRMIEQLDAAKTKAKWDFEAATKAAAKSGAKKAPGPATVYLEISDTISAASEAKLRQLLKEKGLADVVIAKFPETALEVTRNKLRDALGIPTGGVAAALISAEAIAEYGGDDD